MTNIEKLQTKNLSDDVVLILLSKYQGQWGFFNGNKINFFVNGTIKEEKVFKETIPIKLIRSKYKSLVKRGLIGGCYCGCRGDFEITDKGLEKIGAIRVKKYTGY